MPLPPVHDVGDYDLPVVVGEEGALLGKLKLNAFAGTPGAIRPFQHSTLHWDVTVPAEVASLEGLQFKMVNTVVASTGSLVVSPLTTGAYVLTAHSTHARRQLGQCVVQVLTDECEEWEFWPAQLRAFAQPIQAIFAQSSRLRSRGDVSVSTTTEHVSLGIPLELLLDDFFNADVDLEFKIRFRANAAQPNGPLRPEATLLDVSMDMIFHGLEHIFSSGLATAMQHWVEPIAADLIRDFLGPQIKSVLETSLNLALSKILPIWKNQDPAHRDYRLYSISTWEYGLKLVGCPVTPQPSGPGGSTTGGLHPGVMERPGPGGARKRSGTKRRGR